MRPFCRMMASTAMVLARIIAALALAATTLVHAQFAHTAGEQILGRDGQPLHLRGTNLGNWMVPEGYMWQFDGSVQSPREIESLVTDLIGPTRAEAFWQSWRGTYVTRADIHFLHQAGFNSIRVPMRWQLFASDDAEGFRLLDRLVTWARAEDIYLILDLHAAPGGETGNNTDDSDGYPWVFEDPTARQQFLDLWQRVARHYRNEPTVLGYDLLNEPLPPESTLDPLRPMLWPLYKDAAAAIRREDKHHIIIVEGTNYDRDFSVFGPPFDPNIFYEFHRYGLAGRVPAADLKPYLDFRSSHHVPLWLGESGEHPDDWIADFRALLEANNIGWAFWPYKKIGVHSAELTVRPPADWPAIQVYAKLRRGVAFKYFHDRPPQATIDRAIAELLHNMQFANCEINAGYVHALIDAYPADPKTTGK